MDAIGQLVQRLQRERGASCIYLASQTQRFAEVRHQAVNEALLHEEKLRQVFSAQMDPAQGTSAQTLSLMAWALLGLESLPALRLQIDRQAMSALDAVAAYSHLIAGLVELVFHMADTAGVPQCVAPAGGLAARRAGHGRGRPGTGRGRIAVRIGPLPGSPPATPAALD